jgi:hypothetical protein
MSQKGIQLAAEAFSLLQQIRYQLLKMGSGNSFPGKPGRKKKVDHQDMRLAKMIEDMKDAGKHAFAKITVEK